MRVLLVEDDAQLGESLHYALLAENFACDWLTRGNQVLSALMTNQYDLVIMDIGLPGMTGLEALGQLRNKSFDLPVLLLTARDTPADKVKGLDTGADDYLSKPFDIDELYARIRALLRRSQGQANNLFCAAGIEFDSSTNQATLNGEPVLLTATEIAILETLIRNAGRYISKAHLEESVYAWGHEVESNTVEVYISRLRKQFGKDSIETKRGIGYRIPL